MLAVLGNLLELVAAVQRFAADGWASRLTPDLFGSGGGLHHLGATLTVPAHLASMVLGLAVLVLVAVRARRWGASARLGDGRRQVVRPG